MMSVVFDAAIQFPGWRECITPFTIRKPGRIRIFAHHLSLAFPGVPFNLSAIPKLEPMTTIEQWKTRAFIGTLAFVAITVNASYAHLQSRENGSAFVQRMQQQRTAPVITAPPATYQPAPYSTPTSRPAEIQTVNYAPAQAPLISMPQSVADEPAVFIPIEARPSKPGLTEEDRLSRRQEKEEKKEAKEAAIDRSALSNTNTIEVAKTSDKESKRQEIQEQKDAEDMTPNYSDPKATSQISESHGDEHAAATSAAPQTAQESEKNPGDKGKQDDKVKKAVDTKITGTQPEVKQPKPAKEPSSSPSIFHRIVRGFVTGGQSGTEYQNQNSRPDSRQQGHNQNNQSQQNQQNRNNVNNGGGNGSSGGHDRH
jgi:hypothetical protein